MEVATVMSMAFSVIGRLSRAGSGLHAESLVRSLQSFSSPSLLDRFLFSVPVVEGGLRLFLLGSPRRDSCAEISPEAQWSFLSADYSIGGAASVEVKPRFLSVDDRSCNVVSRDCRSGDYVSFSASLLAGRSGRTSSAGVSCDGGACQRSRDGGCARLSGVVLRSRGYAAKTKKAKSRTEDVSDSVEDVGVTSKENAVKMMETALDVLSREHSKLRTGRASAGMLDHITVETHGVRTPLSHIAAVTVSGLQTLTVLPYDASMVKEVEKSILNSPLGLNPQFDGATLNVPLPRLTKEHCETMCKLAGKAGESAKLTIRRARKEALDSAKKTAGFSKDEIKRFEKEVEDLTKKYTKSIDEICKRKEKEIMA